MIKYVFLAGLLVSILCAPSPGSDQFPPYGLAELYVDTPYSGNIPSMTGSPLARTFFFSKGYRILYLAHVFPGEEYILGLDFPAAVQKLGVAMFDRWPGLPGARRVNLPTSPVVRTNPHKTALHWRFSISPRSTGHVLYIVIEAAPLQSRAFLPHRILLYTPPFSPGNLPGRGITHLRGPKGFLLTETGQFLNVRDSEEDRESWRFPDLPVPGDLLENGRFRQGFEAWEFVGAEVLGAKAEAVSLHPGEVRITSPPGGGTQGIRQRVDAPIPKNGSLVLRADVRIDSQTGGFSKKILPLAIVIDYEDSTGSLHQYRKMFTTVGPGHPASDFPFRVIPRSQWFRLVDNLKEIKPQPAVIRTISILGSGSSGTEARVREIHLINREAGQ